MSEEDGGNFRKEINGFDGKGVNFLSHPAMMEREQGRENGEEEQEDVWFLRTPSEQVGDISKVKLHCSTVQD